MTNPDPTGLAKLVESEIAKRTYEEGLSPAVKESGELLLDIVKAFRFLSAPIQFAAAWQDRLKNHLRRVRDKVPEERQVQAPPEIALPVLERLRFVDEDSPLAAMFVELLARSIDRQHRGDAHPAFPGIIAQLSPDEARFLYIIRDGEDWMRRIKGLAALPAQVFPVDQLGNPDQFRIDLERLVALTLVDTKWRQDPSLTELEAFSLSEFGKLFVRACVPESGFEVQGA